MCEWMMRTSTAMSTALASSVEAASTALLRAFDGLRLPRDRCLWCDMYDYAVAPTSLRLLPPRRSFARAPKTPNHAVGRVSDPAAAAPSYLASVCWKVETPTIALRVDCLDSSPPPSLIAASKQTACHCGDHGRPRRVRRGVAAGHGGAAQPPPAADDSAHVPAGDGFPYVMMLASTSGPRAC